MSDRAGSAAGVSAVDARPNDGSGYWADYAPGMSASTPLTLDYPDNSVISFTRFLAVKVYIYGDNLTFVGCSFEGTDPNDNLVQIYADNDITFLYSTFKPDSYATPPGNDSTVSSSHTEPGTPFDRPWQLVTTMKEAVAVSFGVTGNATNITVTGNIFSAELHQLYGFLYGNTWGGWARGSTWRDNLVQARAGDDNHAFSTADNGSYLWPTDDAGHPTDYAG